MTARNLTSRCALAVLSVASVVAVAGCSMLGGSDDAKRDESSGEVTEAADADVFSLAVGDCLDLSDFEETEVETLPVVPCSDPHDSEVYAEQELTGDEIPTDLDTQADQICYDAFAPFVGIAYEESQLGYSYLAPTSVSWDQGDRNVQCIVSHLTEQVTSTLEGSGI
ncbi:MAG TPA: septum formation family protein [Cellulomonas sp.]